MRKSLLIILALALLVLAFYRGPILRQLRAETQEAGPPAPKIKVGETAPDFTLKDQNGKDVALKDFRGKKNVVLAFYVFAFSAG